MADIDTVLERLVTDTAFRGELAADPAAALAGYDLTADDLQVLASSLDDTDSGQRGVEQRTSKSAVLGLLASLTGGGGTAELRDRPPSLDGASKDSAYFGDAAPGGDTEAPMFSRFDDVKGESAATDAPDDPIEARRPGKPKVGEITLKRGTSDAPGAGDEQLAPADPDGAQATAFKQGWPTKWATADAAPGDAPGSGGDAPADDSAAWVKSVEIGALKAGDTGVSSPASKLGLSGFSADPTEAGDFDGDGRDDLAVGPTPAGTDTPGPRETTTGPGVGDSATKAPEDFLTIEDA